MLLWAKPPRDRRLGAVVAGRRGADRRGGRPGRAHAVARPRRRRRGAGPVADDAAGGRPPLLDRLGHGARRPGAGDDAVGARAWERRADPPRQAGRARRASCTKGFRVPGEVIEYAARLLPTIAPGLSRRRRCGAPAASSPWSGPSRGPARGRVVGGREGWLGRADHAGRRRSPTPQLRGRADGARARPYVELGQAGRPSRVRGPPRRGPASLAKGLEFDHVVLLEPAAIVAGEADRRDRAAPALRLPDPGGHLARGAARRTTCPPRCCDPGMGARGGPSSPASAFGC